MWQSFRIQLRVVGALIVREVTTLYGRSNLGAGWLLVEPLTFALPVLVLWSIVRPSQDHGIPMVALLWSGYMPLLLFRHIGGRMLYFVRYNSGLLYHRSVTILDIYFARCIMETVQNIAAAAVMYLLFYFVGMLDMPHDFGMVLVGYFYTTWWCWVVGLIIGALSERSEFVEKIWQPYAYTYIFYGGMWYLADWLPPGLRKVALYQPSLQAYEMIRAGVLGNSIQTHFDIAYDTFALIILTFLGLMALRQGRRYVTI